MPTSWPDDLYEYNAKQIVHLDIAALDLDNGKWFKCTYCKNPKHPEGKFWCRTPFSAELVTGRQGHLKSKSHEEKRAQAQAQTPKAGLASFFAAGTAVNAADAAIGSGVPLGAGQADSALLASSPSAKGQLPCSGLGWGLKDDVDHWQMRYRTYLNFVEGAEKASSKFTVVKYESKYFARSVSCAMVVLPGFQHGIKCCKECPLVRGDTGQQ